MNEITTENDKAERPTATRDELQREPGDGIVSGTIGDPGDENGERSSDAGDELAPAGPPANALERRLASARRGPVALALRIAGSSAGLLAMLIAGLVLGARFGAGPTPSAGEHAEHGAAEPEHQQIWTCSMHPQIRMSEPGSCPICGMDLIPAAAGTSDGSDHVEHRGRVSLSPRAQALAQVKTEPVTRTEPRAEVRLLGRVEHDESRLRTITPWTGGRIDRLMVRVTGTRIAKNRVVARLYSPEIYTATRELALAAAQAKKLKKSLHGAAGLGASTLEAARTRLRLLGVSDKVIESVERTGKAPKDVEIRAPFGGTVLERHVEEGQYVSPGTPLFSVADLSEVWVQIDAYESDLPHLHVGQEVELTVEAIPDEVFVGAIGFIDPVIDKRNRTARVRVEVKNSDGQLRPGMFASAVIHAGADKPKSQLVVASNAPLFTGRRSVVYVELPDAEAPTFELREVRLGPKAGPVYPVLAGLNEGERVVTHGAFLLDADLQLSGGRSMMTLGDDREQGDAPALKVSPAFLESVAPVVATYLEGQDRLAADDLEGARESMGRLADTVNELDPPGARAVREAWQTAASELSGHARHAAKAETLADVRSAFEHVSLQLERLLEEFGNPTQAPLRVAYCPMAFDSRGARWIQRDQALQNPYYGAAMLRCGEFRGSVLPGERLTVQQPAEAPPAAAAGGHQH
ncbi:MAG: efflux RND transporter periplasmic adaptor subunit [Myxococcales bacterium]|nr:efflux RND transporter periplasmic adaptor subunit [Myxococcales bacterium]